MSGPDDGKYWIQLAIDPKPFIGVDPGPAPVKPVITDGSDNVWTVTKLDNGNYTLALEGFGRTLFIQNDDGRLVGSDTTRPSEWSIEGPDGGPYTIGVPSRINWTQGWTVDNPEPKSPVTLHLLEVVMPNQQWNFIRWPGPE